MKLLRVPYVRQRLEYACGPASVQMVLAYFGVSKSARWVWRATRVNRNGTRRRNLVRALRAAGLHVRAHYASSLAEVRSWVSRGVPVIVNYLEPEGDEGHYAVVVGITGTHIIFNDPYHGLRFSLTLSDFRRRWRGSRSIYPRWLLAAMPRRS